MDTYGQGQSQAGGAPVGSGGGPQPVNWGDQVAGFRDQGQGAGQAGPPGAQDQAGQPPPYYPQEQPPGEEQPQQQQQQPLAAPATPAQTYWKPGEPLPWEGSPDAPAMPDIPQQPPVDPQQLMPAVVQANERAIVAHFQALMNQAGDDYSRQQIDAQYRNSLKEYQLAVREANSEMREWQRSMRERQMMVNMVPAIREQHADLLARKHDIPKEMVMVDYFTKEPIWNHTAMERQAQFLAQMGYRSRVEARGNRDAGISTTGSAGSATSDVARMSPDQFRQFRERVRKSNGAPLYRVS